MSDPVDQPDNLARAIKARFDGTPALVEGFPGGIRRDKSPAWPEGTFYDHLVYAEKASKFVGTMSGIGYDVIDFQFTSYATTAAVAHDLADVVRKTYHDAPLVFDDGYLMSFRATGGSSLVQPKREAGNVQVWSRILTFRAKVGRYR